MNTIFTTTLHFLLLLDNVLAVTIVGNVLGTRFFLWLIAPDTYGRGTPIHVFSLVTVTLLSQILYGTLVVGVSMQWRNVRRWFTAYLILCVCLDMFDWILMGGVMYSSGLLIPCLGSP